MSRCLTIVTSNANKAQEVAAFFGGTLKVRHVALDIPELRSDDVREIAREKARYAYNHLNEPLIVDDTAFSIDALNGFPGPYAAYVLKSIGNIGYPQTDGRCYGSRTPGSPPRSPLLMKPVLKFLPEQLMAGS